MNLNKVQNKAKLTCGVRKQIRVIFRMQLEGFSGVPALDLSIGIQLCLLCKNLLSYTLVICVHLCMHISIKDILKNMYVLN